MEECGVLVCENDVGTGAASSKLWEATVEKVMMSFPYIIELDDMLTETDFTDVSLVEDLFQLLDKVRKKS